ncbi:hypothetical protein, partial [Nocardia sp. NPDC004604]|uniref:hypothetical protein n=1 Tax=Nocardia sp. NPDC004604 TaxID=3157013 RepID=UPI0033B4DFDD
LSQEWVTATQRSPFCVVPLTFSVESGHRGLVRAPANDNPRALFKGAVLAALAAASVLPQVEVAQP